MSYVMLYFTRFALIRLGDGVFLWDETLSNNAHLIKVRAQNFDCFLKIYDSSDFMLLFFLSYIFSGRKRPKSDWHFLILR